jgi:ferrous iron transport protein B
MNNEAVLNQLEEAKDILSQANIDHNSLRDQVVSRIILMAEDICSNVITVKNKTYNLNDRKIDEILTSRHFGIPIMVVLLGVIFWLTISGANVPSQCLVRFSWY